MFLSVYYFTAHYKLTTKDTCHCRLKCLTSTDCSHHPKLRHPHRAGELEVWSTCTVSINQKYKTTLCKASSCKEYLEHIIYVYVYQQTVHIRYLFVISVWVKSEWTPSFGPPWIELPLSVIKLELCSSILVTALKKQSESVPKWELVTKRLRHKELKQKEKMPAADMWE